MCLFQGAQGSATNEKRTFGPLLQVKQIPRCHTSTVEQEISGRLLELKQGDLLHICFNFTSVSSS